MIMMLIALVRAPWRPLACALLLKVAPRFLSSCKQAVVSFGPVVCACVVVVWVLLLWEARGREDKTVAVFFGDDVCLLWGWPIGMSLWGHQT